jgi:hypothetical protein
MKVWYNNRFEGIYPVGAAAVVVAESAEAAAELLRAQLTRGVSATVLAADMVEIDITVPQAIVLNDGDY